MPFRSKAQMRKFFAMQKRGELPAGTAEEWADETPNIKKLPEKLRRSTKGSPPFMPKELQQGYRKLE